MSRFIAPAKRGSVDKSLDVVILAAGAGRRLKSKGSRSLFPVRNTNLINHQITTIRSVFSHAEITVVLGYEIDRVYKTLPRNVRVVENAAYETTTSAKSAFLGIRACASDNILIVNGDLFFDEKISAVCTGENTVLVGNNQQFNENKVGLILDGNHVSNFGFGLDKKWGQAVCLHGGDIDLFQKICSDKNGEMLVHEVMNSMINKGVMFMGITPPNINLVEVNIYDDLSRIT